MKRKKIVIGIVVFVVLATVSLLIANTIAKNKLKDYIVNLPEHITIVYDDLDVSLLQGNITLKAPLLTVNGKTTNQVNAQVKLANLDIKGFGYWSYLFNDKLKFEALNFETPLVTYYHNPLADTDQGSQSVLKNIKKALYIKNFNFNKASVKVINVENDSIILSTNNLNFLMTQISINDDLDTKTLFKFKSSTVSANNLTYQVGKFENLSIDTLKIDNTKTTLSGFSFKTKYDKTELSNKIATERDHFELISPEIIMDNHNFKFDNTKFSGFTSDKITITQPDFTIYRDKLVADDLSTKDLYSKMLRTLNIKLDLKLIEIVKGKITYQEKVKPENEAGQLTFSDFNARLSHVSNTYKSPIKTKIKIDCNFMQSTPLKVDWSFDVNDKQDNFVFKADLGGLKADHLNQFMQPNLNLKLEGDLAKTMFTIDGNAVTSNVDLKTKYTNFDIILLKENGNEKNKLLSKIINIFVSKDSKDAKDNFRNSNTKTVERDQTKSIFNFVWKNAQAGLISAMAGDGKKDN
ncbi:AsmA family protein [Olleya marilimosa]|uniref:hypothetical protein n=1 Tax=Olleya marilimosa TaxID=272164 RepID=UPI00168D154E|nr:hypothetical protein [Olleya marilimosa]MBD3890903.1 hypothetical protein [Olleya marilimosa]